MPKDVVNGIILLMPLKKRKKIDKSISNQKAKKTFDSKGTISEKPEETALPKFPPSPASDNLKETIIQEWCADTSPDSFMEGGCTVCGQLTLLSNLSKISELKCNLNPLLREGMGIMRCE